MSTNGPFQPFTTLPIQIFNWTEQPSDQFRAAAAAGIVVLLALLLVLNATAIILRQRFSMLTSTFPTWKKMKLQQVR